jgi:hypothetical protein
MEPKRSVLHWGIKYINLNMHELNLQGNAYNTNTARQQGNHEHIVNHLNV